MMAILNIYIYTFEWWFYSLITLEISCFVICTAMTLPNPKTRISSIRRIFNDLESKNEGFPRNSEDFAS